MKQNMYAIFDTCSGVYDGPIPGKADAHMIRSFSDLAINADHPIGKHPEHYALVKVGQWNDSTGEVTDYQNTTMITGLEAVANSKGIVKDLEDGEVVSFGGNK